MPTNSTPIWTIADRFRLLIEALGKSLGMHGNRRGIPGPLLMTAWVRIRRLAKLFASIEARLRAGTLITRPRRPSAIPRPPRQPPAPDRIVPYLPPGTVVPVLPRRFGWLRKLVPELTASGGLLTILLQTPEMRALFAEAPQLGKVLRPLAHTLGVRLSSPGNQDLLPGLVLPRRKRVRQPDAPRKPRPARPRPPPAEATPFPPLRLSGPPWRTRADAEGIPRKILG